MMKDSLSMGSRLTQLVSILLAIVFVIIVSVTANWVLISNMLAATDWWYIPLSVLLLLVLLLNMAWRLNLLLVNRNFGQLIRSTVISNYYAFLLPSAVTADIARYVLMDKNLPERSNLLAGIVVDKLVSWVTLVLMVAVTLSLTNAISLSYIVIAMLMTALVFLGAVRLSKSIDSPMRLLWISGSSRFKWNLLRYLPKVTSKDIAAIFARRRSLILNLCGSFFHQLVLTIYLAVAGDAVGLNLPFESYMLTALVVQLSLFLPLTVFGIGLKDVSQVSVLVWSGANYDSALAMTAILYPSLVIVAFIGGLASLRRKRPS